MNNLQYQIADFINNIHPLNDDLQIIIPLLIHIRNSARIQELYMLEEQTQIVDELTNNNALEMTTLSSRERRQEENFKTMEKP